MVLRHSDRGEKERERKRERTMADVYHSFLGLLVTVLYLLTGVSGDTLPLNSIVGGNVSLPCNNVVYPNCSSTTWTYNRDRYTGTIEEVGLGRVKKEVQNNRADRLSLGSNCSLHVSDVRAEDAGVYICQQFLRKGGPQYGGDGPVHLSVLTDGTTLNPVKTTTSTEEQSKTDGTTLNPVKTTTSTQEQAKTDGATLNPVKTTTSTPEPSKTDGATLNPVKTTTSTPEPSKTVSQILIFTVAVGVAVVAVVCVIAAVIIVRRRREKNQVPNDNSIGLNAVNHSTPPTNDERSQPADRITYASIDHFNQNSPHRVDAQGEDAVTYASVMPSSGRGREPANPADASPLYSTVSKPQGAKTST